MSTAAQSQAAFKAQLKRVYGFYTGGFAAFVIILAILEQMGMSRTMIGYVFLAATVLLYAGIGVMSRTNDAAEYYVAGRRVPAVFNGMATGADWMSAASFIGMAGTLYLTGYGGLAFIMGWTGGYVLVALFLAPYLRKFGQFTIPDFLGARYGGHVPRFIGIVIAIICSFTYVVAQIYGVGLITTRLTGVQFEIGIFLGLAGILVCSFLGGMKAVTWTQVAQYIILIIAYLIPAIVMSFKLTGIPIPQLMYGVALDRPYLEGRTMALLGAHAILGNEAPAFVTVPAGETLIHQNQPADAFYLLVQGRLRAFVADPAQGQRLVGEIMPGESIMLLRLTASRTAGTVTAVCVILAGSSRISYSGSCPPCTITVATPVRRFSRGFMS